MVPATQLGRRSSVSVLAVTAAAVAMLAILVAQTSRHESDAALVGAVGRLRMLGERAALSALLAGKASSPDDATGARDRFDAAASEWLIAEQQLAERADGRTVLTSSEAVRVAAARAHQRHLEVISAAVRAMRPGSSRADAQGLVSAQRGYLAAQEDVVALIEAEAQHRVDTLVQIEAACVALLLAALGLAVRLALRPAQERLAATRSALAETEARTVAMLDAMSEGMVLTDTYGRFLTANPSARRMLGIGRDEPVTIHAFLDRLVDVDEVPLPIERFPSRVTMRSGVVVSDVVIGIREEGRLARWLSASTHALRAPGGGPPAAVVTVFHDITHQRQLEAERTAQAKALELQNYELLEQADALEREQALFRSLVDTAGTAIVGLDLEGRVFEWNRESEALFGTTRAEAVGRIYADEFIPDAHQERMRKGIAAVLGGEELRNETGPVRGPHGERRLVIWNITPLRTAADGPVHGLIAAGLDITDREASDERFRVLFERSSDAHLLFDDHGVIDCNDATLRLLQMDSKAELLGRTTSRFSPRRQPDGRLSVVVAAQMAQVARDRGYHRFEWVHQRADGTEFPVEVTLTPVRLNAREAMLAVWHDIAERKAVESALRAAKDAAESANRTKSEFMTRMNHELRTPLTAIIGFSKVLLQGKQGALSEGAQRFADRIHANGLHLLSLINQILDVAKVEAGRMALEPERIAVDELVRETLRMLESTADAKGIVLRATLPSDLAPVVTDAAKLRQILINLVGNAVKFTVAGEVCVSVEADGGGRPVSISVRDTGIGIPLERQQKVFEPFEQGDSSTRREFGGTGLGLSIVKTFAELIGAAIEVESEVGHGTTFTIWLAPADLEIVDAA